MFGVLLQSVGFSRALATATLLTALLVVGCGSSPTNRAPVEDRGTSNRPTSSAPAPAATPGAAASPVTPAVADAATPKPGAENAGKPGFYTVKPGDTLIRIGLDNGQNWRDIVRWNGIENPNQLEVGQVLRVVPPPPGTPAVVAGTPAPTANGAVSRPVATGAPGSSAPTALPPAGASSQPAGSQAAGAARPTPAGIVVATAPATAPAPAPAAPAATSPEDEIAWIWPTNGAVLAGFDEVKNKGLDIGGVLGAPVVAAADGRVVYVGAGLRGYGNLIILKHNNTYLTAYAHNQTLLVKEDQAVRKGQKIAEMGSSDADRVKLHFEVRRQGKPVDPAKFLPPR